MDNQVWLMGGLGNQLFQVNYGFYLMEKGEKVRFNTLLCTNNGYRYFSRFKIHDFILPKLFKNLPLSAAFSLAPFVAKTGLLPNYAFWSSLYEIPKIESKNYFGYFQNRRFVKEVYFNKNSLHLEEKDIRYVLHLRFRDNPRPFENHENLKKIIQKWDRSYPIYIITDDKSKSATFLSKIKGYCFLYTDGDLIDDFSYLASARSIVASDSTLSWWACKYNQRLELLYLPKTIYMRLGSPIDHHKLRIME